MNLGNFSDLSASDWACKYAETALANGMVAGNDNFRPDEFVSMIEGLKMVFQARELERDDNADWRAGYVDAAVEMGIATPFTNYDDAVTRGQMFIWAVEAIDAGSEEEVAIEDDLLCGILGTCSDDTTTVEAPVEDDDTTVEAPVVTTGGTATVSLSPLSPSNGLAAVNTPRVAMLAFDVTAGDTDVTLEQVTLYHVGLGNRDNVDDVTIYDSRNASVSKTRNFNENDLDISFDRDVVVQAGTTQTFTIGATLNDNGSTNTTYQIELGALEASATVSGAGIIGAALTPTNVSNSALLEVEDDTASESIDIGEEVTLAGFTVEEKNDNEDVLIRTITLVQNGSVSPEYIEDLVLEADGIVVASDLFVDGDDELVINLDYVLAADDEVDFELMGVITGDVNETVHFIFEEDDAIFATGMNTGFNIGFEAGKEPTTADIATEETIEGAEINVVFDKSDIDETKVDVDDVLVGTLELTANSNDYEIEEIQVTVTGSAGTTAIEDLNLDGTSFDDQIGNIYIFEDIILTQGVTEVLPLEFDVVDNVALNGTDVIFEVQLTRIEDDENNITYTVGGTNDISDILSSNSFDTQNIDIETSNYELTQTALTQREVVLANGVEVILYKGKLNIGDADSVEFRDIDFPVALSGAGYDLEDILDSAELNIGGETDDADIEANSIEFNSLNIEVPAGATNVDVLLTAILEDNDDVANGDTMSVTLSNANIDAKDSDNEDVVGAAAVVNASSATVVELNESGTLAIAIVNDDDLEEMVEEVVLTGTPAAVLAEVVIEADEEDVDIEELVITLTGTAASSFSTFSNVRIMDGATVIADGAEVTQNGANTRIEFEDFIITDGNDEINALLVADIEAISDEGGEAVVVAGDVMATITSVVAEGESSNDPIVADLSENEVSDAVNLVPALLTASVQTTLAEDDEDTIISFTIDEGSNDLDNDDLLIRSIEFTSNSEVAQIDTIENDEGDNLAFTVAGTTVTFTGTDSDYRLNNGDDLKITVLVGPVAVSLDIEDNGIGFEYDGAIYQSSNENELDLGTYTND